VEYADIERPELSANQLSEFIDASPIRKEGILRQARYVARESSPPRIRYSDARRSIAQFLADKVRNFTILNDAKNKCQLIIEESTTGRKQISDFALSDAKLSIESIDAFIGAINPLGLSAMAFTLGEDRPPRLSIEGVAISVRPDVIVTSINTKREPIVGGLLMYFGKNGESDTEKISERRTHGLVSATLVYRYAAQHLSTRGSPERKLCMALDIFVQKIHRTPASNVRRMESIDAACRIAAAMWPGISPPDWWPT